MICRNQVFITDQWERSWPAGAYISHRPHRQIYTGPLHHRDGSGQAGEMDGAAAAFTLGQIGAHPAEADGGNGSPRLGLQHTGNYTARGLIGGVEKNRYATG